MQMLLDAGADIDIRNSDVCSHFFASLIGIFIFGFCLE
jgi:hypothetical protein